MEKVNSDDVTQKASIGIRNYSINSILTYFLQFLSTMLLSKLLNASDYGVFGTIRSWIASVSYFTDIGISEGLVQQKENLTEAQIKNYLAIRSFLSLVVCSILHLLIILFHKELGFVGSTYSSIFLITVFTFLDIYASLPKLYFSKKLEFSALARTEFVSNILLYVFQIGMALFGFGFWSLFFGLGVKFLIFIVFGISNKLFSVPSFNQIFKMKSLIKRGFYFQLTLFLIGLSSFLVPFLLNYQLPTEEVGIYFWINSLVTIPVGLILNFQSVLFPTFSKLQDQYEDLKLLINKSFNLYSILMILIFYSGLLVSDYLIDFLFQIKWSKAKEIVELICFSTAFYCIRQIPQTIMTSLARSKDKLISELSYFAFLILPLIYLFIQNHKISLLIFSIILVIANVFGALISFWLIRDLISREVKLRYGALFFLFFISAIICNVRAIQSDQLIVLLTLLVGFFISMPSVRSDLKLIIQRFKKRK